MAPKKTPGSGKTTPKWTKGGMTDKFDFEHSVFSPTKLDDSFISLSPSQGFG